MPQAPTFDLFGSDDDDDVIAIEDGPEMAALEKELRHLDDQIAAFDNEIRLDHVDAVDALPPMTKKGPLIAHVTPAAPPTIAHVTPAALPYIPHVTPAAPPTIPHVTPAAASRPAVVQAAVRADHSERQVRPRGALDDSDGRFSSEAVLPSRMGAAAANRKRPSPHNTGPSPKKAKVADAPIGQTGTSSLFSRLFGGIL